MLDPPAPSSAPRPAGGRVQRVWSRPENVLAWGLVGLIFALHLPLVFPASVKGDEFRFLGDIYRARQGTLELSFQTFHVHFFRWLPLLGGIEVDQVIAARLVYYVLLAGSCIFVYLIGRRFYSQGSALFVVLCYLSMREVIATGTSFRYDGASAFLLLAALAILMRARVRMAPAAAGALVAIALLVTVKSIFYLPTLLIAALLREPSVPMRRRWGELALFGIGLAGTYAILFTLHHGTTVSRPFSESAAAIQAVGPQMLRRGVFFPARDALIAALVFNPAVWLFLGLGVVAVLRRLIRRQQVWESLLLTSLLLPLFSLVVYRNAFAYYYVLLMPAVLVVAGARFDELLEAALQRRSRPALPFLGMMVLVVLLSFVANYRRVLVHETVIAGREITAQRQVLLAVHRMFPEPVPYIDGRSMVSSFPKVGFFMSAWCFEDYHAGGKPIFPQLIRSEEPRFLLVNSDAFRAVTGISEPSGPDLLFEEDVRVLTDNYVAHWGPVLVAGKRLALEAGSRTRFDILVGGPYTIESERDVILGGVRYEPGRVVTLGKGTYHASSDSGDQAIVLRWGIHLHRPEGPPPQELVLRVARPAARPTEQDQQPGVPPGSAPPPPDSRFPGPARSTLRPVCRG